VAPSVCGAYASKPLSSSTRGTTPPPFYEPQHHCSQNRRGQRDVVWDDYNLVDMLRNLMVHAVFGVSLSDLKNLVSRV
jgi:hypothetical protein